MKLNVAWTDVEWEIDWHNAEQQSELTLNSILATMEKPSETGRVGNSVLPALSFLTK